MTTYNVVYKQEGSIIHAYIMFGPDIIYNRFLNADETSRYSKDRAGLSSDLAKFADSNKPVSATPPTITVLNTDPVILP